MLSKSADFFFFRKRKTQPKEKQRERGQIALWMLSKFAMIFFIVGFAFIIAGLSDREKSGICDIQAESVASSIASSITNVINSPVEDERKVVSLETRLSLGKDEAEKYTVNITDIQPTTGGGGREFRIQVKTPGKCGWGGRAPYAKDVVTHTAGADKTKTIQLTPSEKKPGKSYYLIIIKCRPKAMLSGNKPYPNHVYLHNCKKENPDDCLGFNDDLIAQCCGWKWTGQPVCK